MTNLCQSYILKLISKQLILAMQKLFLTPAQTFLMDVVSWIFFHLSIGFLSTKIPHAWMNPNLRFFMSYAWEKNGEIYEKLFHVRAWKDLVPDGSRMYRGSFSIKHLPTNDPKFLIFWLKESIRAELCHWAMIVPGFLFFLWNDIFVGWLMVLYAILNNLVPIIMQRFNRPRMRRLIARRGKNSPAKNLAINPIPTTRPASMHPYQNYPLG